MKTNITIFNMLKVKNPSSSAPRKGLRGLRPGGFLYFEFIIFVFH